ncbi:hypothetical protein T265_08440 [Opisthorchis viverrini]|uniref:Cystatin domain-containing protein n=1 Tax=Opisthorchis viverrini TaxID=6198 RepID=A0A074ZDQ4_OPIVI|nr:hypothetical protein T265_08440 [Opisthorchis viverrini]KER23752.1 hypothetical protein T265_08440 [Opisthorchis viverrini]
MLSNCFIFLALSFISPSSETLVGGYTEFHLPNADEIQTFKTLLNLQIPTFLGLTASDVDDAEILGISSQVVSGINYRINWVTQPRTDDVTSIGDETFPVQLQISVNRSATNQCTRATYIPRHCWIAM